MQSYYTLRKDESTATVYIYGDITADEDIDGGVCASSIVRQIEMINADTIHVHIDSYGGAVSEGWAIYNALLQHPAKINTYGDGFVASAALFPFLAGDNRYASNLSAYYLHEVLVSACGYADDLRAAAQDADTMTSIGIRAFVERAGMREEDIRELMRSETWLTPEQALEYNIATAVTADASTLYTQDAKKQIFQRIFSTNCPHPERTIGKKPERAKKNNILKLFERG